MYVCNVVKFYACTLAQALPTMLCIVLLATHINKLFLALWYIRTYALLFMHVHTCTYTYIHTYTCTYIHVYVHMYVGVANLYEKYCCIGYLRSWAASECLKQIKGDDQFTNCISIGPVSIISVLPYIFIHSWCH